MRIREWEMVGDVVSQGSETQGNKLSTQIKKGEPGSWRPIPTSASRPASTSCALDT